MDAISLLSYDAPVIEFLEVYLESSIASSANLSPSVPTENWSGGSSSWSGGDIEF